jgi:GNAT superfamily N-acetyltransferase
MSLISELDKIKKLIYENQNVYEFIYDGDIDSPNGLNIQLKIGDNVVGHTNLINFRKAWDLDWDIPVLYSIYDEKCVSNLEEDYFDENNSLFLFDLKVFENYRGQGLGEKLLQKCHEICKNFNKPYCLLITNTDNIVAQNLYKKNNYQEHIKDESKIFYYKNI